MADTPDSMVLKLLRELREDIGALREAQVVEADKTESIGRKLDKLTVEVIGVKGRVRKVEEGIEAIARVMTAEA